MLLNSHQQGRRAVFSWENGRRAVPTEILRRAYPHLGDSHWWHGVLLSDFFESKEIQHN